MYNRYTPQSDGSFRRDPVEAGPRQPPPPTGPGKPGLGVGDFFRQLLPRDFDMEDLLIVILLLLMSGDGQEDENFALLTLALYLFL